MDMTGVYASLFETVCDVTTVPSHLKCPKLAKGFSRSKEELCCCTHDQLADFLDLDAQSAFPRQ